MKIIYSTIISTFLISCGCIKMELKDKEKKWCSYEKNELLLFKSNLNNIDTLFVEEKIENYTNEDCNNISLSYYQLNRIYLLLSLKSKTKSLLYSEIILEKNPDLDESRPRISIFGLSSDYPEKGHKAVKQKIKLKSSNKIYRNAYWFKDDLSATNINDGYLDSFYYDKNYGLIKYISKDGEVFELFKRIRY